MMATNNKIDDNATPNNNINKKTTNYPQISTKLYLKKKRKYGLW